MGYDPSAVIEHPHQYTAVDQLFVAPHPIRLKGNQLQALPHQLKWVGDRIKSGVNRDSDEFSEKVYISRQDAERRRVTNEDELMRELSQLGFERYEPGRLSLEDQITLFANADVIVGPHGLAYTNLIYASDATLIELFPENGATETYFVATEELGIDYEFFICSPADTETNIRPRDHDLIVPVPELVDLVRDRL
jgi:capsular polysaccharide biosynthesis protein